MDKEPDFLKIVDNYFFRVLEPTWALEKVLQCLKCLSRKLSGMSYKVNFKLRLEMINNHCDLICLYTAYCRRECSRRTREDGADSESVFYGQKPRRWNHVEEECSCSQTNESALDVLDVWVVEPDAGVEDPHLHTCALEPSRPKLLRRRSFRHRRMR